MISNMQSHSLESSEPYIKLVLLLGTQVYEIIVDS